MNDKNFSNNANVIDLRKRQAIKGFTCMSAISLLASMQSLAAEPLFTGKAVVQNAAQVGDIEATLISSPDLLEDTLLLRNLTSKKITVTRFRANKLVFDGGIVDCNDACAHASISIPAGTEVSVQIHSLERTSSKSGFSAGEYLNVESSVSRLPGGTRIVPMVAHMIGEAAVLSQAA